MQKNREQSPEPYSRRTFLRGGTLLLAAAGIDLASEMSLLAEDKEKKGDGKDVQPNLQLGLVTDLHYADKKPAGSRHYRASLDKLAEARLRFEADKPQLIFELGDLIDAADNVATEKIWLKQIADEFSQLPGKKHCVLGNHCVATLSKQEFLDGVGQEKSYYSFDASFPGGGYHFVVLDACFRSDGEPYNRGNFKWSDTNLSADEIDWLAADLKATSNKTLVFVHQRLDVKGAHGIGNAPQVRKILELSDKVLAVFQGHNHVNDHKLIEGIHYCTMMAMVEGAGKANNAYSVIDILPGDTIRIRGFRKQEKYDIGK